MASKKRKRKKQVAAAYTVKTLTAAVLVAKVRPKKVCVTPTPVCPGPLSRPVPFVVLAEDPAAIKWLRTLAKQLGELRRSTRKAKKAPRRKSKRR